MSRLNLLSGVHAYLLRKGQPTLSKKMYSDFIGRMGRRQDKVKLNVSLEVLDDRSKPVFCEVEGQVGKVRVGQRVLRPSRKAEITNGRALGAGNGEVCITARVLLL
jgi:hypothetical protein